MQTKLYVTLIGRICVICSCGISTIENKTLAPHISHVLSPHSSHRHSLSFSRSLWGGRLRFPRSQIRGWKDQFLFFVCSVRLPPFSHLRLWFANTKWWAKLRQRIGHLKAWNRRIKWSTPIELGEGGLVCLCVSKAQILGRKVAASARFLLFFYRRRHRHRHRHHHHTDEPREWEAIFKTHRSFGAYSYLAKLLLLLSFLSSHSLFHMLRKRLLRFYLIEDKMHERTRPSLLHVLNDVFCVYVHWSRWIHMPDMNWMSIE